MGHFSRPRFNKSLMLGLSTLTAASLALSACGGTAGDGDAAGETAEIEVWFYPVIGDEPGHRAFWDEKVAEFEAENEGISVSYEIFPWANRDESIQTGLAGGVAPDLIYLVPDQLSAYADSIEPMDAYIPDEQLDNIKDNVREDITVDKGLLGVPLLLSSDPLVCNGSLFEQVGAELPETWDDMRDLAPVFAAADLDLLTYYGSPEASQNGAFYPLLWQAGGQVFTDDGSDVAFDGEEGLEALTFLKELNDQGVLDQTVMTSFAALEQTGLASGDSACEYGGYQPSAFTDFWDEEDIMVLPPLENAERIGYGTIGTLAMFNTSESKDAAGAFAAFVARPEVLDEFNLASNYYSPFKGSDGLYDPETLEGQAEGTVEYTTIGQLHPNAREVMGLIAPEIQSVLLDGKDPQQALDDAAASARSLM